MKMLTENSHGDLMACIADLEKQKLVAVNNEKTQNYDSRTRINEIESLQKQVKDKDAVINELSNRIKKFEAADKASKALNQILQQQIISLSENHKQIVTNLEAENERLKKDLTEKKKKLMSDTDLILEELTFWTTKINNSTSKISTTVNENAVIQNCSQI